MRHVAVCVCTFKRPALLQRLLAELEKQQTGGAFSFSVVVVDNDSQGSAEAAVSGFAAHSSFEVSYCCEPEQNIAKARNRALANARGDFIAFIDDDEYPASNWISSLLKTCDATGADGVLGPVLPYFEGPAPRWALHSGVFDRPRHTTGYRIQLSDARTGNVLLRSELTESIAEPFQVRYATGGEDVDFFRRMMEQGRTFVWCDEAPVYELVPSSRCSRKYLFRRALLRGGNSLKQRRHRLRSILKSATAVPLYALVLPPLYLCRSPRSIKYAISFCDHVGKLLALVGLNPVRDRDM